MYIQHELESLELEQSQIDEAASRLEKNIREVMGSSESELFQLCYHTLYKRFAVN
jgi:hypothetical protein